MSNQKRVIKEILEKRERGEKLTEREARMLAYFPYGTDAGCSFASVAVRTDAEEE